VEFPATVVAATSAVETSTIVAVKTIAAVAASIAISAAVAITATIAVAAPVAIPAAVTVVVTVAISPVARAIPVVAVPRAAIIAAPVVPVIPRTGAYEDATDKIAGAVIAIGRAFIRIIVVVAILADRSRSIRTVYRTYSDAHGNLCRRVSRGKK
jgi:hypothetical protein